MHRLACALVAITIPAVPVAQAQQSAPDSAFVTTDTTDPLNVRFHFNIGNTNGPGGSWSPTVTVKYQP